MARFFANPFRLTFDGPPAEHRPSLERSARTVCYDARYGSDLAALLRWAILRAIPRFSCRSAASFPPLLLLAAASIVPLSVVVLPGWLALVGVAFGWALLALAWVDQRTLRLPDSMTLPLGVAGLITSWLIEPTLLFGHVIGAVAGFGVFAAVGLVYRLLRGRYGLGGGDAKLLGAIGAWIGWQGLPSVVLYATFSGLGWVLARGLFGQSVRLSHRIPFGPHLCLGAWLVWLHGPLLMG